MKNHVDEYQIVSRITRGKESELYKGTLHNEEEFAIKIFSKQASENQKRISFLRTAVPEIVKLQHPNLVRLYKDGMVQDRYYYVMEFFESLSLHDYLYIQGVFRESQAVHIILQIANALLYCNEQNIIHGNLSSESVLIDSQKNVKVFNIGLIPCRRDAEKPLKKNAMVVGNPQFFSPEQIQGNQLLDLRTDIFSLGVLFYRLLSGIFPFEGWDDGTIVRFIQYKDPIELEYLRPNLSSDLIAIISKMLKKNPDDRYNDYESLISDLEKIQEQSPEAHEDSIKTSKYGYCYVPQEKDIYVAQNALKNNFITPVRLEKALERQEFWGASGAETSLIDILEIEKFITKEQRIQLEAIALEFHKNRSKRIMQQVASLYEFLSDITWNEHEILPQLEVDQQTWRCYYAFVKHMNDFNEADAIFHSAHLHEILRSSEIERCVLSYSNNIIRGKYRPSQNILIDKFSILQEQINLLLRAIRRNRMTGVAISRYLGDGLKQKSSQDTAKKWKISSM